MKIKTIAAIICGDMLTWGVAVGKTEFMPIEDYLATPSIYKMSMEELSNDCNSKGFVMQEVIGGFDIIKAAEYMNNSNYSIALSLMRDSINQQNEMDSSAALEDITRTAEDVIDIYSKFPSCRNVLLELADAVDRYAKEETTRDVLKCELEKIAAPKLHGLNYSLWITYDLEVKNSHSIEDAHDNIRDYFERNDISNYLLVDYVLDNVENGMQGYDDSRFVNMVKEQSPL